MASTPRVTSDFLSWPFLKVAVGKATDLLDLHLAMEYADHAFELMVRGTEGGRWYATPKLIADLWVKRMQLECSE